MKSITAAIMTSESTTGQDAAKEKETQDTRRVRNETSIPRPSQDAELKDYVCRFTPRLNTCQLRQVLAIGRLSREGSSWICFPSFEHEYWRDCCSQTDQARRSSQERVESYHGVSQKMLQK